MTRYVVEIARWYEVEAEDDDAAKVEALAEDESEDRKPPIFTVTDLDEAARVPDNSGAEYGG